MTTFYQLRGTMSYCAPETYEGKQFTTGADVFSLGVVMWEMLYRSVTGEYQRPYAEYTYITEPFQIIIQAAQFGLRPTVPAVSSSATLFSNIIHKCWLPDPSQRPSTQYILQQLELCKADFDLHADVWNDSIHAHRSLSSSLSSTSSPLSISLVHSSGSLTQSQQSPLDTNGVL
jgi:hypothetical protein